MQVNANIDPARLLLKLEKGERRLAFGVVGAINDTMKLAQKVVRDERLDDAFTVRDARDFLRRRIAKLDFASVPKGRLYADLYVDATGVQGSRLLLPSFEEGGERVPVKGKSSAIPIPGGAARPSFASPVEEAFEFRRLRLRLQPRLPEGKTQRRRRTRKSIEKRGTQAVRYGLEGTYQIPGVGVFRRRPGQKQSEIVYLFRRDQQIEPRLDFRETVTRVIDEHFDTLLRIEIENSFRIAERQAARRSR